MANALFTFADYFLHGPLRSGPVRQLTPKPLADNALLHMLMRPFVHTMSCFVAPRADAAASAPTSPPVRSRGASDGRR